MILIRKFPTLRTLIIELVLLASVFFMNLQIENSVEGITSTSMKRTFSKSVGLSMVSNPSGLIPIFKPKDWTSADVVAKVKGIVSKGLAAETGGKVKIKVGHGGTLDPLAEGVVVIGIGKGTTLLTGYLSGSKKYIATGVFGTSTDSLDSTGAVTGTKDCTHISYTDIEAALPKFIGNISQVPPMYSALKRDGQRLYDLARAGVVVEREPRQVHVYDMKLLREEGVELPRFKLEVECSGGVYVRSLIDDLSKECGGLGHMTDLLRCKQGPFLLEQCLYQEDWTYEKILDALERYKDIR